MGLSFDLTVEELPPQILDQAWAYHSFLDATNGCAIGYGEASPNDPTTSALFSGEGTIDLVSAGRWAGIQPVPGSWVINKIMCANGTVFLCGNYRCKLNYAQWTDPLNNWDRLEFLSWDPTHLAAAWTTPDVQFNGFLDGFFAACKYDEIDNPAAWHILPTRSQLELPESNGPATNDPYYVAGEPIPQQTNQGGGLMDMCIDQRSFNTFAREGWEAMEPELSGNGAQPLVIQCVGYMPCGGYGTTVHNSTNVTAGYKWSIYAEQDFIPVMYSFVVNIFNDQYSGNDSADIYKTINPQMINSQITSLNSNIGGAEIEFPYEHWGFNWCIGNSNIEGQNPLIQFGYGQPDQCGSSMATQGAFSGTAAGIAQGDWQAQFLNPGKNLRVPWCSGASRFGSLQIYPFEQVTYRAHQIGISDTKFNGTPFYPQANTLQSFEYENQAPRQPSTFPFCPTPLIGQFPIRKPAEMAFSTPNFLSCKSRYQNNPLGGDAYPRTSLSEYAPKPNYYTPLMGVNNPASAITDGEIWRHGFIPRQLTGITPSYNTFAGSNSFTGPEGLYYPTFEQSNAFPDFNNFNFTGVYTAPTSLISYFVITGNCLEDPTTDPALTYSCKVSGGKPVYSPLCVVTCLGQSYAGFNTSWTEATNKGIPNIDNPPAGGWQDEPDVSNYANVTWMKCFTRQNISLEDVNAENACNLTVAPTNSSLDNATFVKPLPAVRADYPAPDNQLFNVGLLLQVNELAGGTDEKRAEIYILQPWTAIDSANGIAMDTKTIVPYITWYGWAEAIIADRTSAAFSPTACLPNANAPDYNTDGYLDIALMPSEWIYTQTQGVPLTTEQVAAQKSCFHTYVEPITYTYGEPTGLAQIMLGHWNRTTTGLGWKPFEGGAGNLTGPTVHAQDPGNILLDVNPVINEWTTIPNAPVWGGVYRLAVPYNGLNQNTGSTVTSPDIYDSWDKRVSPLAPQVDNPIPQQYLAIPTTNTTKCGDGPTGNLFSDVAGSGAGFQFDLILNQNELGINAVAPPGATQPMGTGQYTTLGSLVDELNASLDSYRSAGNPWDLPFSPNTIAGVRDPKGLKDIAFYETSDGTAIYVRDINQTTHVTQNLRLEALNIRVNNAVAIEAEGSKYYPHVNDSTLQYQYLVMPSEGPIGFNNLGGGSWACAAVNDEPNYASIDFNIINYGNTFNKLCPGGATTTRRPVCADFDLDRAQWMMTLADNDKAVSEEGNGFAAISVTPDFSEFLDQTENFGNIPDFYNIAVNNFNSAATTVFGSSLWAARQGSPNLDGIIWIGIADYNRTQTYPSITGVQDTSLSYVWANYWCDDPNYPVPINVNYPEGAPPWDGGAFWTDAQYMPLLTYQGAGVPFCYSGNTAYQITGTTGRKVQVWLNYVLYDEIDSIIAVECQNLGLRVTPENVEWYKRKILKQDSAEMTLEEIEEWMSKQRQEYQDILKERNRGWKMRKRREEAGTLKPSATETLEEQLAGDFYALDEESIEELLPQLNLLPPNPDTDEMMDVDAFGNSASGDIQKTEEKRRDSEN